MRWTLATSTDERGELRTAKARGPDPPMLGSSRVGDDPRGDGD